MLFNNINKALSTEYLRTLSIQNIILFVYKDALLYMTPIIVGITCATVLNQNIVRAQLFDKNLYLHVALHFF